MKTQAYLFIFIIFFLSCAESVNLNHNFLENRYRHLFTAQKKIDLADYPGAFNPSLFKHDEKFILTFRYTPHEDALWISYIGIVILDESLEPVSEPQLVDTRSGNFNTPSQSEDCRIFSCDNKLYLIYNDNTENTGALPTDRRDMYVAELTQENGRYAVSPPLKLMHETQYSKQLWQKNWVPFEWEGTLLLSYTVTPHEILLPDLQTGLCKPLYKTSGKIKWDWGKIRGGTPAIKVGDDYLAFFHSSRINRSQASKGKRVWHYYMGAYLFSSEPPFKIKKYLPSPLIGEDFYTESDSIKHVVFPGGFVIDDNKIHIAYGKDDSEIWIATIEKNTLLDEMVRIKY